MYPYLPGAMPRGPRPYPLPMSYPPGPMSYPPGPMASLPPSAAPPGAPSGQVLPGGTPENPLAMGHPGLPRVVTLPLSPVRAAACRCLEAARNITVPVCVVTEVDMSRCQDLYRRMKPVFEAQGIPFTYTTLFARATVKALQAWPMMNSALTEQGYLIPRFIDLGIATQAPGVVIVPAVRNAESLDIPNLAREIYRVTDKARNLQTTPEEVSGQTFTITNPGKFANTLFGTPTIAPGNTGILSFEVIQKRPVVTEDDRIVIRPMMYMSLSADHRAVDGVEMTGFIGEMKRILETASF